MAKINTKIIKVETSVARPTDIQIFRGETVDVVCHFKSYDLPIYLTGYTGEAFWRPIDAEESAPWYSSEQVVIEGEKVTWTWTPDNDTPNAKAYDWFVRVSGLDGASYKATGTIQMLGSPAGTLPPVPAPPATLDFSKYTLENAPWPETPVTTSAIQDAAVTPEKLSRNYLPCTINAANEHTIDYFITNTFLGSSICAQEAETVSNEPYVYVWTNTAPMKDYYVTFDNAFADLVGIVDYILMQGNDSFGFVDCLEMTAQETYMPGQDPPPEIKINLPTAYYNYVRASDTLFVYDTISNPGIRIEFKLSRLMSDTNPNEIVGLRLDRINCEFTDTQYLGYTASGNIDYTPGSGFVFETDEYCYYGYVVTESMMGRYVRDSIPQQANADWTATSGVAEILHKPVLPTAETWTFTLSGGTTVTKTMAVY